MRDSGRGPLEKSRETAYIGGMSSATDPSAIADFVRRNGQIMGPDAAGWSPEETMAWLGLLVAHRNLSRGFGKAVEEQVGLSPTALGVLGRLIEEPAGRLRISALAEDVGLSLSRTSRVVDALEHRGLVFRAACPGDARATNAVLSDAGRTIVRDAQAVNSAWVHEHFLGRLSDEEIASLASIFERFTGDEHAVPCDSLRPVTPEDACGS